MTPSGERLSQDVELWRAGPEDVELVAPLFDSYRAFYSLPRDLDLCRRFLLDRIENDESVVFIAGRRGREGAGFIQMYPTFSSLLAAPMFVLYDLFVDEGVRRKGLGRLLMERARRHAEATGARLIALSTARTNDRAQRLYESLGYKKDEVFLTYELSLEAPSSGA